MTEFKLKRQEVDPKGKFLIIQGKYFLGISFAVREYIAEYVTKTVLYQITFLICILVFSYTCLLQKSNNGYKLL